MPDDPQPASPPRAAARASSAASSAAANPLVADAGPAFDPKAPTATPIGVQLVEHEWAGDRVGRILKAQGLMTHELIGVGVEDWLWRQSELDAIGEPLAAAMNRIPMVRAAAAVSDELTVGAVMFEYSLRSIRERTRVLRAQKAAEEAQQRPVSARSAPVPAGPRVFTTGAVVDEEIQAEPARGVDWEVP